MIWAAIAIAAAQALAAGGKLVGMTPPPTPWEELERYRLERLDRQQRHDARVNMAFLVAIAAGIIALVAWCLR